MTDYRSQTRGGKGVINIQTTERNGLVTGATVVTENSQVMLITSAGQVIRFACEELLIKGRNTQGVRLVGLDEGETVAAVAPLAEEEQ